MNLQRSLAPLLACAFSLLVGATPVAQIALRAARLLDVERGVLEEPGLLVVEGERIVSVGGVIPDGVTVVDLGDRTLLPGLMDLHTHLSGQLAEDSFVRAVRATPVDGAIAGVGYARLTLLAGFTTVRDLGSAGFVDVALANAGERGDILAPRIVPAGHALSVTGGHGDVTGFRPGVLEGDWRSGIADGVDEVVKAVRYQIKHGAKVIKVVATAGVLSFEGPVGAQQYSLAELTAVVEEARRHGVRVAAHAHGTAGILAAVRAGVTSIEHGSMLDDEVLAEMQARGTYLVPTTYLADAIDLSILPPHIRQKAKDILPLAKGSVRRAIRAGVRIAYGTDAGVYPHGLNARELAVLVERGMTPAAAIQTATIHAADCLGVTDRGRLAAGLLADVIAVSGNPLEDVSVLEHVDFVMKGGEIIARP